MSSFSISDHSLCVIYSNKITYSKLRHALSQAVILRRTPAGFLHGIFGLVLFHLAVDDLILVKAEFVEHIPAVHEHVRQFFTYVDDVILRVGPLEALEKL